uniref:Beta-glucosidase n=1 Tax=Musa acuminata subsp. malaccensis TaxID=214687 RepID=A0A804KJZ1_MUSAM|nr:PREDICTED: beta-glucosidase 22-like [Musa acuminata subsp. malaccensis]
MRKESLALLTTLLLLLLLLLPSTESKLSRDDFPPGFIFGAGTSAYQVEGAAAKDGRTPSLWDTYTHAGRMLDNSTGDVASDQYHKYKEDVKLMADTGLDSYRFSISWSRLIPNGRGAINLKGLAYYNNLIDELLKYGIKPHVTIYHLDFPQALEDEYGGWLSQKIVEDFTAFADVCFREFGDRVSQWTTIVEPNIIGMASYDNGVFPPNRCSKPFGLLNCTVGDSTTEPYIATHNLLLSHASVVSLYRTKYQAIQNGRIGLNVYSFWCYPMTNSRLDFQATQRSLDFLIGWIISPLVFGDYPKIMKKIVRSRLPSFTEEQSEQVKGSFDFIGLNHYQSIWVKDNSNASKTAPRDFNADLFAKFSFSKNDTPSGQLIPADVPIDPDGLQHMLEYIRDAYGNPPVYIEENGYGYGTNDTIYDVERVNYLSAFISSMLDGIRKGANVKGYYVWSFLDVFEFLAGFQSRFGLYYVDFKDENLRRQPKLSALWYSDFLKKKKTGTNINRMGLHERSHSQQ